MTVGTACQKQLSELIENLSHLLRFASCFRLPGDYRLFSDTTKTRTSPLSGR